MCCHSNRFLLQLNGFIDRYSDSCVEVGSQEGSAPVPPTQGAEVKSEANPRQMNSPLMLIEGFLQALTSTDSDGRIVITRNGNSMYYELCPLNSVAVDPESLINSSLKFLLLNPSLHFSHVVREAGAVVVAGGTMQPVSALDLICTCTCTCTCMWK